MAVAHDAVSNSTVAQTGNLSWTHTPVGTPAGAVVGISQDVTTADQVSGVTYGGVTMTRLGSIASSGGGDLGRSYLYFLGSGVPGGAQTVAVTVSGAASKSASAATITSSGGQTQSGDIQTLGTTTTNPSVTLTISADSLCYGIGHFGEAVSLVTPAAALTQLNESGYSTNNRTHSFVRVTTNPVTGTQAVAWTFNNDGAAIVAAAIMNLSTADNSMKGGPAGMYGDLLVEEWF